MSQIDWAGLLRLGLHGLRLTPDQFWQLTPAELMVMAGHDGNASPALGRDKLAELMAQFPDRQEE